MSTNTITYAKAGGPPANWCGLIIVDLDTGLTVSHVLEVDTEEGWVERFETSENGSAITYFDENNQPYLMSERIEGRFEIRRPS
jgi:hypothetical protein